MSGFTLHCRRIGDLHSAAETTAATTAQLHLLLSTLSIIQVNLAVQV